MYITVKLIRKTPKKLVYDDPLVWNRIYIDSPNAELQLYAKKYSCVPFCFLLLFCADRIISTRVNVFLKGVSRRAQHFNLIYLLSCLCSQNTSPLSTPHPPVLVLSGSQIPSGGQVQHTLCHARPLRPICGICWILSCFLLSNECSMYSPDVILFPFSLVFPESLCKPMASVVIYVNIISRLASSAQSSPWISHRHLFLRPYRSFILNSSPMKLFFSIRTGPVPGCSNAFLWNYYSPVFLSPDLPKARGSPSCLYSKLHISQFFSSISYKSQWIKGEWM